MNMETLVNEEACALARATGSGSDERAACAPESAPGWQKVRNKKKVKIILCGFGVVGSGVAEGLIAKRKQLERRNIELSVVGIMKYGGSITDENGIRLDRALKDFDHAGRKSSEYGHELIEKIDADMLLEMTPTNVKDGEPGMGNILSAFKTGKDVVTSNKGPLAIDFRSVMHKAQMHNRIIRYEATVCAAIPTFNLYEKCLFPNDILSIKGILNGTTNFVLTKMHEDGVPFDIALQEAKELGYAETNPSYDIDGIDAAAKATILANALMGIDTDIGKVAHSGIRGITKSSVELAVDSGFAIKLIAEISHDSIEVAPRLIPAKHPLNVGGSLNAIMFKMDMADDLILVGRGAGKTETASAVISDTLNVVEERRCR